MEKSAKKLAEAKSCENVAQIITNCKPEWSAIPKPVENPFDFPLS